MQNAKLLLNWERGIGTAIGQGQGAASNGVRALPMSKGRFQLRPQGGRELLKGPQGDGFVVFDENPVARDDRVGPGFGGRPPCIAPIG